LRTLVPRRTVYKTHGILVASVAFFLVLVLCFLTAHPGFDLYARQDILSKATQVNLAANAFMQWTYALSAGLCIAVWRKLHRLVASVRLRTPLQLDAFRDHDPLEVSESFQI